MKDMNELREKADTEKLRLRADQKMVSLEEERDWFREEALRLNKLYKDSKQILDRMKIQMENAQEDRDYYQMQLYEEKVHSKELQIENIRYKQNSLKNLKELKQDDTSDLKPSAESIQRMKRDIAEIENLDAVKEYKFITQQLQSEPTDEVPVASKKMIEENNLMKFKI